MRHTVFHLIGLTAACLATPSLAQTLPEGPDHATQVLGNPWDMSAQDDVHPLLWTHNLSAATVAAGVMTGVARDTDPHFWLQFPRIPSAIQPINLSQAPIDAGTFNKLSFMMWLPESVVPGSRNGRLVWHKGGETVQAFDASYSESPIFPVYPGWHVYHFDLASMQPRTGTPWIGSIQGLRLDPCLGCQVAFKLDWARLHNDTDPQTTAPLPAGKKLLLAEVSTAEGGSPIQTPLPATTGGASTSKLPPGTYRVAAITDGDYALTHRGKPWAFQSQSDALWIANSGITAAQVGPEGLSAITAGNDPYILLDVPQQTPIEASQYKHISIDLTVNQIPAQESGLLVWWGDQAATVRHSSPFTSLQPGRRTYQIDLSQSQNWTGLIRALRIDPLNGPNAGSNVAFTLHSVRLTKTSGFQETVSFHSQPLVVNGRPKVDIVSPSLDSGDDYAIVEQGLPWSVANGQVKQPQLSNLSGWEYVDRIPDLGLSGRFFHATSNPAAAGQTEGDPHAFLLYQENTNPVDAQTYRWLGFDLYVPMDATQQNELTVGAVARLAWKATDTDPGVTSDDIVLMPGLQRYWFDMAQLVYEPASPRVWGGELVRYLRIDPFEFPASRHFYLGAVQLRSTPTARMVWPVVVKVTDSEPGDKHTLTVKSGTTVLASAANVSTGTHQLIANLASLPEGAHTLTVEVSDGMNVSRRTSSVPINKLGAQAPMPAHQLKAADRIFAWAESLLGPTLGGGTPSGFSHECMQSLPGYGRYYASTGICLFVLDGLILYRTPASGLTLAGSTVTLLEQAAASGK